MARPAFNDLTYFNQVDKRLRAAGDGQTGRTAYIIALNALDGALGARIALAGAVEQITEDKRLSDVGRAEKIEAAAEPQYLALGRLQWKLAKAMIAVEAKAPTLPPLEPIDAANAIVDVECRAYIRTLPKAETDRLLGNDVDARIWAAIARAPAVLSGVSPSQHRMIVERLIAAAKPDAVKLTNIDRAVLKIAAESVHVALDYVRQALNLPEPKLQEFEQRVLAPLRAEIEKDKAQIAAEDWSAAQKGDFGPLVNAARERIIRERAAASAPIWDSTIAA